MSRTLQDAARLLVEIFRQIAHRRLQCIVQRMALLVGRVAHRPDVEAQSMPFQLNQFLGDEGLRQSGPALENDCQAACGPVSLVHASTGVFISDFVSAIIFSSPSMNPAGAWSDGGL